MGFSFRGNVNKRQAYRYLRNLIEGLNRISNGAAQARAAIRIAHYFTTRTKAELSRKRLTGRAQTTARALAATTSVTTTLEKYTLAGNFKPGSTSRPARPGGHIQWSWFNGIPQRDLKRAGEYVIEEAKKLLDVKG